MRHETEYALASKPRSRIRRLSRSVTFVVPVLLSIVVSPACSGGDSKPAQPEGKGRVTRAILCRKEWTQLNYGWWTLLEPHVTDSSKEKAKAARQQARKDLEDENKVLPAKIRQIRSRQ